MAYGENEHAHRFATWAACTAARASPKYRFKVRDGKILLESVGINAELQIPGENKEVFDQWHKAKRNSLVEKDKNRRMTHGIAAKLLNVYLKARYLGQFPTTHFHPPLDDLLIKGIKRAVKNNERISKDLPQKCAWSLLTSDEYEQWIRAITELLNGQPLWMIEEYWTGHH
jgi:hypothetical protein